MGKKNKGGTQNNKQSGSSKLPAPEQTNNVERQNTQSQNQNNRGK